MAGRPVEVFCMSARGTCCAATRRSRSGRFVAILPAIVAIGALGKIGCLRSPTKPVPVAIVSWSPAQAKGEPVDCDVPDLPSAPETPAWPEVRAGEPFVRAWVHRRDYEDLLVYTRDLEHHARSMAVCLEALVERSK